MINTDSTTEIFKNLSIISEDENLLKRAARYLRKPDAERTVKDDCRMSKKNTTPNLAVLNSKFHALKISDQTQLDIARLKRTDL